MKIIITDTKSDDALKEQMIQGLKHVKVEGEFIGKFVVDSEKGPDKCLNF